MRLVTVATCNLNQWAMDFKGNLARTLESIAQARRAGAAYRLGPELEVTGYGCEDHFLEQDTIQHAWECVAELLSCNAAEGMVVDVGMPAAHAGVRYNCRVLLHGRRILLIRPKMDLANDGNYREPRWFATWKHRGLLEEFRLPDCVRAVDGQSTAPFGDGCVQFADVKLGTETCEELFTPMAPHIGLALGGVEVVGNGSGSHHELRKLSTRVSLIRSATAKAGGVYLYANQRGCDGGRLYYDGCALIVVNGEVVAQGSQFSLVDVEVVTATVDLDAVVSYRGAIGSLREQASAANALACVRCDFSLTASASAIALSCPHIPSPPIEVHIPVPEEEIAMGPACWLWDYLRRSGACGFLLPLSGGADSSSVAAIVGCMCQLAVKAVQSGNADVTSAVERIGGYDKGHATTDAKELAQRVLHTVYMGTVNSSDATRSRAQVLAGEIGASHLDLKIDSVVSSLVSLFTLVTGKQPQFKVDGGSNEENLALQNIQARLRMVVAFLLAQLLPWCRGRSGGGFLLVLGSANVDEALRGYLTKYDCSSADINPIGGISKTDLRKFLRWGAVHLGYPSLADVEAAPPTAELEPIRHNHTQLDEVDMGMTYAELSLYGRLRKVMRCGPVSMFQHLCHEWGEQLSPAQVASKVKDFFRFYSINRHKMTTLTPSYHAENYSPDDNRFDLRQFLYNTRWPWQFEAIDRLVAQAEAKTSTEAASAAASASSESTSAGRELKQ